MRGKQIKTVEEVILLARAGKCVVVVRPVGNGGATSLWRTPAAFLQCWQANMLYNHVKNGMLYEYRKPAK